jgi:DcuC family C4-dicarboxylate transporter
MFVVLPQPVITVLGLLNILAAVMAVAWRIDVRLALGLAALALGALAQKVEVVGQKFLKTMGDEQFVLPICCAMGFAYVLRQTGCDQHLVQLLVKPVRRVRPILLPGTVVVGFLVNTPIISQTSTAVTIGPVLVPLLQAARLSPLAIGSALLLGASIGGELLNPGAPELQTISKALHINATECVAYIVPVLLIQLVVATGLFWVLTLLTEERAPDTASAEDSREGANPEMPFFRVNPLKAVVPLVPLVLLFLTGPPLSLVRIDPGWLLTPDEIKAQVRPDSRLIGAAMLIGAAVAAATAGPRGLGSAAAFFEGAGHAFATIISLIVCAQAFGEGVKLIGLDRQLGHVILNVPGLLFPLAIGVPLVFALLSGSGYAATQSLYGFFVDPARQLGVDPASVGALVSLGAAAGRTMSPVAAVAMMCGALTGTQSLVLVRRVCIPLLGGLLAVLIARTWLWPG